MAHRKVPRGSTAVNTSGVGYKRPPKHSQFRKGVSGNPKGSKKRSVNLATAVRIAATEKIVISAGGEQRTVSAIEATILKLRSDALSGKPRAAEVFLRLLSEHCPDLVAEQLQRTTPEADRQLVASFLERVQSTSESLLPTRAATATAKLAPKTKG